MSSASHPEGLAIARKLIAREAEARTGFLDLGCLGLKEMPEELRKLTHLRGLNLGRVWKDPESEEWQEAAHDLAANNLWEGWESLGALTSLEKLHCAETELRDLQPLAQLAALTTLYCSSTQISDLQPLAKLAALTTLNCSGTQVSDLKHLAQFAALTSLNCCHTKVCDLRPLSQLATLTTLHCSGTQVCDLNPLAQLTALTTLDCSRTQASSLKPLAHLAALTTLHCSGTQVCDLNPLAQLAALTELNCSNTKVSNLQPLAQLAALSTLACSGTQVNDLRPLAKLASLTTLDCFGTQVSNLQPLAQLAALTTLNCSRTQVNDLKPLAQLTALTMLYCSGTQVSDLRPLAQLAALTTLNCSRTQVNNLKPLAQLTSLTMLNCSDTQVSDLLPLAQLAALSTLDCSGTQVCDLQPLAQLAALTSLHCSYTEAREFPAGLVWHPTLTHLYAHGLSIEGLPAEVLSSHPGANCLESLRSHLRDLKAGEELLPDVKVIVIGNGRIGKTQICRRLRGEGFEAVADSTHGITVTSAELAAASPARLHLWDFGGQDLYHGTHALFMKTRAVFVLVWTPEAENAETHEHGGMTFRNQPLAYWLSYVRHLGGTDSPVLLVQNLCDTPADELLHPPLAEDALEGFGFRKLLHYSAKADRGRAALDEALRGAIDWLRETQGQARIGTGRLRVKRRLEALRDADAALPAAERRHRVISQAFFQELCDEPPGGVSSAALLLDYLHQCGIVFYQRGLFGGRIVLDQAWALEAVYAIFNRTKCYRQLQQLRGRFTRTLLEALVWQEFSVEEQKLFLSMMETCGICFIHRHGSADDKVETEYLAPDLLPERSEVEGEIEARWPAAAPYEELVVEYPFLHAGVVRRVIAQVGQAAGISAVYWKEGVCGYERGTRCHLLLEVRRGAVNQAPYVGAIVVRASGAQPGELLRRVEKWIDEEGQRTGSAGSRVSARTTAARLAQEAEAAGADALAEGPAAPPLEFDTPPRTTTTYCVSYSWKEESFKTVDALCARAKERGIHILRDTNGLGLGERISQFMSRLAAGDRVFIILSAGYLQSPYCMAELFEVWRNCRGAEVEFLQHIRVFRLPDAAMLRPLERAQCAVYWKKEFEALNTLVKEHGADILGASDFQQYKLMQDFAHRVGDILALIADTLLPKDFEELV